MSSQLRAAVTTRHGNVLQGGEAGLFDLILFRNVLPSVETASRVAMMTRIVDHLEPDGVLMLGMAETLIGLGPALSPAPGLRGFYVRTGTSLFATAQTERVALRA
jgi:chemotaxis protein methyltransferase CheR